MAKKFYYPDELPAKVVEILARKVEAAKGKVIVLVHPFFIEGYMSFVIHLTLKSPD